jgi:hypothetical protein
MLLLLIITKILSLLKLKKLERTRKRKSYYFEAVVPLGVGCFNLRINTFFQTKIHTLLPLLHTTQTRFTFKTLFHFTAPPIPTASSPSP